MMNGHLGPDRAALETFVGAMFRHADAETFIAIRAFDDERESKKALIVDAVRVGDDRRFNWIFNRANQAAELQQRAVFCLPIATFRGRDKAAEDDIANGVSLSVDCDQDPETGRRRLTALLGSPSVVVASGGDWANPATGEIEKKLHLHWRLSEPTRDVVDHEKLKLARKLACAIVGGDPSAAALSHSLRAPGSVHRKNAPKLARIVTITECELELGAALEVLRLAAPDNVQREPGKISAAFASAGGDLQGDLLDIVAALSVIPNQDPSQEDGQLRWDDWNRIGMAIWLASSGQAFAAFDAWSRKSAKYSSQATAARWNHYSTSPPHRIGAGTLYHLAAAAMPGWRKPSAQAREARDQAKDQADEPSGDQAGETEEPKRKAKASRSAKAPPGGDDDKRPVIRLLVGELSSTVDQVEAAMIAAELGVYQRGGGLVTTGVVPVITADKREVDCLQVVPLGEHAILERVMTAAGFEKWDARAKDFVPANPPMTLVKTLEQRSGRLKFPVLAGIVNAPTMKADGSLLEAPGYDETTGLLFDPAGATFPKVPEQPTRAEAEQALELIEDLLRFFPFETDADQAVALSVILTSVVRRSLRTAPLHAFTAPVAGSGKSKLVDIASVIATGREAGVVAMGSSPEELEKRLGSLLLSGSAIAVDNCEGEIASDLLCQLLTQTTVRPRILGQSQTPEMPTNMMVTATGNNLRLAGDMTRRAVLCRLDPKVERPELRSFDFEPVAKAKADRGRYVVAALTLLRAYHVAGRPQQASALGSFETWSSLVRSALLWLGKADPISTMEQTRTSDPRLERLRAVMVNWETVIGTEQVTAAEVALRASERHPRSPFDPGSNPAFMYPEFREALLIVAQAGGYIDAGKLGKWLGQNKGRVLDGSWLECDTYRKGVSTWRLFTNRRARPEREAQSSANDPKPQTCWDDADAPRY